MATEDSGDCSDETEHRPDEQPPVKRPRPAIVIHPPEQDGDREKLIAALAAAVVAIARARAGAASESSRDTPGPYGPTVKSA